MSPAAASRTANSYRGTRTAGFPAIRRRRPTWRAISAKTIDATRRRGGSSNVFRSSVAVFTRPCLTWTRSAGSEPTTISCRCPRASGSRWRGFAGPDGNTTTTSSNRSRSSTNARCMRRGFLCRRAAASGFASLRGGSLKPPGTPILEKDVAKAESGGGAETRSDLDVVASYQ
jgi:hypothetical protein